VLLRSVIVDDNESFLEAARGLLEEEGLRVAGVASTPAGAFRQVQALDPDIVLVDVFLGEESGLELARRARFAGWSTVGRVNALSGRRGT